MPLAAPIANATIAVVINNLRIVFLPVASLQMRMIRWSSPPRSPHGSALSSRHSCRWCNLKRYKPMQVKYRKTIFDLDSRRLFH
jgi:hypothetical protein